MESSPDKLFFCDLDGTLLIGNKPIQIKDIEAMKEFQKQGYKICINTGRSYYEVKDILDWLPYDYLALNNGGELRDKENIIIKHRIPYKEGSEVLRLLLKEKTFHVFFTTDDFSVGTFENETFYVDKPQLELKETFEDFMLKAHNYSILCFYNEGELELTKQYLDYINANYSDYMIAHQNEKFVDIVPKNCSKGTAINDMKTLLPEAKTYGIGDSYNDLSMFQNVDESASFYHANVQAKHTYHYVYEFLEDILGDKL